MRTGVRTTVRRLLLAAGWAVVAVGVLAGLCTWLGPVQAYLIGLVAFAPWLLFAAWPVAVAALATRRWPLGAAAVAVVAVHVLVLLPSFAPWHAPPRARPGTTFTVYDQNVRYDNTDLAAIGRQVLAADTDLVVLEEVSYANLPTLPKQQLLSRYPYLLVQPRIGTFGFAVLSKLPLADTDVEPDGPLTLVRTTLAAPGGSVRLVVVHTTSPVVNARAWRAGMDRIAAAVRAEQRPMLVVGDFNATQAMRQMRQMRQILDTGLRDGADADGDGWRMTWPNGHRVVPRAIRIDHALFSPGLTITGYHLGRAAGSDHSPLLFTVGRT